MVLKYKDKEILTLEDIQRLTIKDLRNILKSNSENAGGMKADLVLKVYALLMTDVVGRKYPANCWKLWWKQWPFQIWRNNETNLCSGYKIWSKITQSTNKRGKQFQDFKWKSSKLSPCQFIFFVPWHQVKLCRGVRPWRDKRGTRVCAFLSILFWVFFEYICAFEYFYRKSAI